MQWFDTHAHLDLQPLASDAKSVWQQARAAGVCHVLIPGVSPDAWAQTCAQAARLTGAYWAAGLHPWWLEKCPGLSPEHLQRQLHETFENNPQCPPIAVGECGLDGTLATPVALQIPWLEAQLEVAQALGKPAILHAHKAHNEVLQTLKKFPAVRGVIHGFAGSVSLAEQYLSKGWLLGIGGVVTYERAQKTRTTLAALPAGSFVLETDAPAMPIAGRQGLANTPSQLIEIASCVAGLRNESMAELNAHTGRAAKTLWGTALER
ncbi:TatD family hydrolase [Simiduia sp. 21SJ11W-1]|uniref:TatD family hydrolase n=1 Tax=Simiduia sp. 21SJ11W-1 TaxID=2909669 RepID=UPI00209E6C4D|nr:TatD family hydrolase [Simiduia sp. 21SJ11W-1]UTA47623.1 TatD family hydrolase [Simiduia sp. 21SJ11W-1]